MEARERELKLLALLLQYPDAAFRKALPELAEAARVLARSAPRLATTGRTPTAWAAMRLIT